MKKCFRKLLLIAISLLAVTGSFAQNSRWESYNSTRFFTRDSITKEGYTLIVINTDSTLDSNIIKRMAETFFTVYPKEAARFNPNSLRKVTFIIDTAYHGVAATGRGVTRCNPKWFHAHPEDLDVVTHEVMHIVQHYHGGDVPGWLTEGIADYARYRYGVNNVAAGWTLPDYNSKQSYKNAYRVTARFLVWLEKNTTPSIVDKLDAALRDATYTDAIWIRLTGKTVDELWEMYGKDPTLELHY